MTRTLIRNHLPSPRVSFQQNLPAIGIAALLSVLFFLASHGPEEAASSGTYFFLPTAAVGVLGAYLLASIFYSRLSAAAGIALTLALVALVVLAVHNLEFWLFRQHEQFGIVLVRRLVFAIVLFAYLFRQAFLNQKLKQRESAELHAQVQALQSRIRPHFLFNSMNVIASLIPVDADKAEQVVEDLSELFRASLQEAGSFVSVSQELDLCRRYVNIETLRLGERLKVSWDVEAPPKGAEMPLLLIQPLIENAVYHGIQPIAEGGIIHVNLVFERDQMTLTITNPIQDPARATTATAPGNYSPKPPSKGNSIAIDNIRRRLDVVYGESATLITKQQGNLFKTTLCCPTVPKFL
jgi:two-component system sensor histidine kinase AlgZ